MVERCDISNLPFFLPYPLARPSIGGMIFVNFVSKHHNIMKFFIDTANLDQIKEAHELGILDGVTTNPSLMAKEGIKGKEAVYKHYLTICEIVKTGDVSAEVVS